MDNSFIGFHKKLNENEEVKLETPYFTHIHGKESSILGSDMVAKIYLTNQRMLVLTFMDFASSAPVSNNQVLALNFEKSRNALGRTNNNLIQFLNMKHNIKTINMVWLELPLNGIESVNAKTNKLTIKYFKHKKSWHDMFRGKPEISFVVDAADIWRAHLENHIRPEDVEENKITSKSSCSRCGSTYKQEQVKMVRCPGCQELVCRQHKIGTFRKTWEHTGCFLDDQYRCMMCKD